MGYGYKDVVGDTATANANGKKKLPLRQYVNVEFDDGKVVATYVAKIIRPSADNTPSPSQAIDFTFSDEELLGFVGDEPDFNRYSLPNKTGALDKDRQKLMDEISALVKKDLEGKDRGNVLNLEMALSEFVYNEKYLALVREIAKIVASIELMNHRHVGFGVLRY